MTHRSADRRTVAGLLAVAAAVGLAACGGSGTGNGSGDDAAAVTAATAPAAPARSATAPIRRLPAGLAATFAPFRSQPEGLPDDVTSTLRQHADGAGWTLAQRLPVADGEAAVWALPGRTSLCLVLRPAIAGGLSESCTALTRALAQGVSLTLLSRVPGPPARNVRTIVGMVPDGTRRVRAITPREASTTAPVTGGTFTIHDAGHDPPQRIALLR